MINMKDLIKKQTDTIREESGMIKEASKKWAVKVSDIGTVIVNASGASEAKRLVAKKLRGGVKDIVSVSRALPTKKVSDIDEGKLNEVDFSKIKLPSQVDRFLNKFVDAMKGANLNRLKRSAILYKVIDASGMSVQQLMADIQKIKKEL